MPRLQSIRRLLIPAIAILLLGFASLGLIAEQRSKPGVPVGPPASSVSRAQVIQDAVQSPTIFDCLATSTDTASAEPAPRILFKLGTPLAVVPPANLSGNLYGGFWSPGGDVILFSVPSGKSSPAFPAADSSPGQPVSRTQNQLWLYGLADHSWTQIPTDDGDKPRFSAAGDHIYFLNWTRLMDYDLHTGKVVPVGPVLPESSVALLSTSPSRNGGLLSPVLGSTSTASASTSDGWRPIDEFSSRDEVMPAPDDRHVAITLYTQPALTVLYGSGGFVLPLLRNCYEAHDNLTWSQDGSELGFPVRSERTAIYLASATSGMVELLTSFSDRPLINGISFSPNGRFLALSVGDQRSAPSKLWIISSDGRRGQVIGNGAFPRWSPTANALLYVDSERAQGFQWYILPLEPSR